jgi:predicted RNase H-like nuclease (RuvC/YqgF family)
MSLPAKSISGIATSTYKPKKKKRKKLRQKRKAMKKTNAQLQQEVSDLQKENLSLKSELQKINEDWQTRLEEAIEFDSHAVKVDTYEYNNLLSCRESADYFAEKFRLATAANTELINTIATLNGGVLKDLSQTILNLTKR